MCVCEGGWSTRVGDSWGAALSTLPWVASILPGEGLPTSGRTPEYADGPTLKNLVQSGYTVLIV